MNPYATLRTRLRRPLFIPCVVLGDPNPSTSVKIVRTLVESGADALELVLPFSDPPADGPVIQAADTRALKAGTTISGCFAMLRDIRTFTAMPIGLLVYFNLVLQRGIDRFYADCKRSGVQSVLIADLPLEHAKEILPRAKKHGIAPIFLVSEVTTDQRMEEIASVADGYLYVVSYLGVTGVENAILEGSIRRTIRLARKHSPLPLVVGFGINTPDQASAAVQAGADGVIVASRIVREVPNREKVAQVCKTMRQSVVSEEAAIPPPSS
jgi:tryptophan synthase alpha chain